ncbi:MAG: ATPase, partial [Bacteroidales bacterium]|nr:ATPase [Bacteroidales bacterium]
VVTPEIADELVKHLRSLAQIDEIEINNDLMGAARGACGHEPGIAAILGTGSNTCFYDGSTLSQKVYSGGYVIGDEGSGASLGKLFLADFIKGLVPDEIARDFAKEFDSSYAGIVQGVYRSASPSGYLGSLAPFILRHYSHPYAKALVDKNFQSFIDRSLLRYDTARYPVGIVGGFGWACKDIITPLLDNAGIKVSRFIKAPIEGLCEYHR